MTQDTPSSADTAQSPDTAQSSPLSGRTVGFLGVGEIGRAMVTGLADSGHPHDRIVLSPRGADNVSALTAQYPDLTVATDNQAVVRSSDVVVLAVRTDQAEELLAEVDFHDGQTLVSAVAELSIERINAAGPQASGKLVQVTRCIPLPPVDRREGTTVFAPPDPVTQALFDALGRGVAVADQRALLPFSVLTATFTGYLQYLRTLVDRAVSHGVERSAAEAFVRSSFAALSPALRDESRSFDQLVTDHETPGGLNEAFRTSAFDADTVAHIDAAFDALWDRIVEHH
ncbi:NAD(P)-binding domain-containing protein [Brevibacterium litoralis]|uniref:NAD(P)-binding domain-containing protein n=1 Tax=Brevibacterium litoralis TaxID=3138935 RepID=UPI0032ECCC90